MPAQDWGAAARSLVQPFWRSNAAQPVTADVISQQHIRGARRLASKPWWFQLLFWVLVSSSLVLLLLVNQLDPGSIPHGIATGEARRT